MSQRVPPSWYSTCLCGPPVTGAGRFREPWTGPAGDQRQGRLQACCGRAACTRVCRTGAGMGASCLLEDLIQERVDPASPSPCCPRGDPRSPSSPTHQQE